MARPTGEATSYTCDILPAAILFTASGDSGIRASGRGPLRPVLIVTRLLGPRVLEGALTPVKEGVRVGIQPMYSVCTGNASCDQCKR